MILSPLLFCHFRITTFWLVTSQKFFCRHTKGFCSCSTWESKNVSYYCNKHPPSYRLATATNCCSHENWELQIRISFHLGYAIKLNYLFILFYKTNNLFIMKFCQSPSYSWANACLHHHTKNVVYWRASEHYIQQFFLATPFEVSNYSNVNESLWKLGTNIEYNQHT